MEIQEKERGMPETGGFFFFLRERDEDPRRERMDAADLERALLAKSRVIYPTYNVTVDKEAFS